MELPWMTGAATPTDGQVTVMASKFRLTTPLRSLAFLRAASRIHSQARHSAGLVGISLRAHPLRGEFWTLSAWTDEAALQAFARANPHRDQMKRFHPHTKEATFRFFTAPADSLAPAPLWAEGVRLINEDK